MIPFHLALLLLALQGIEATSYKSRKPSVTVTGTKFMFVHRLYNMAGSKLTCCYNSGLTNADTGIDSFLGIPFAQPPVNERRLREPEAFEYSGVSKFTADSWSPACTQPGLPIENDFTVRPSHLQAKMADLVSDSEDRRSDRRLFDAQYLPTRRY